MTAPHFARIDASREWHRMSEIADNHEPAMRLAFMRYIKNGKKVDKDALREPIARILVAACFSSAESYGLVFNPTSSLYAETISSLTDTYASNVDSGNARSEVKAILPKNLSLPERKARLNTFGLDARSALVIERHRQELDASKKKYPKADIERTISYMRNDFIQTRGNLMARTETNRIINTALEVLWIDNMAGISKARRLSAAEDPYQSTVVYLDAKVAALGVLPRYARKEWVTRRDGRVCSYCDPLEGTTAAIGTSFDTIYGFFKTPPAHPQCRCIIILA